MRRRLLAILVTASIFAVFGPDIRAQSPAPGQQANAPTVNLTAEQRHVIKELLKELKVTPVTADAPTSIGEKVPESVVAQPIPVEIGQRVPQVRSHAFYIKGDNIVVVDPKDRTVADVIN